MNIDLIQFQHLLIRENLNITNTIVRSSLFFPNTRMDLYLCQAISQSSNNTIDVSYRYKIASNQCMLIVKYFFCQMLLAHI